MNRQFVIWTLSVVTLWSGRLVEGASRGEVKLVHNGQPVADLVVAPDAGVGVRLAAKDLQEHLELMTGARLPVVEQPSAGVANHVYVGESKFTRRLGFSLGEFHNSGFAIEAKGRYVILAGPDRERAKSLFLGPEGLKRWQAFCGQPFQFMSSGDIGTGYYNDPLGIHTNDDLGTWYAVAECLEQLGVRWYMPYQDGTVIPQKKTVAVAWQGLRKEADFARRQFCYYGAMRSDAEGIAWFKRLKLGNRSIIIYNHTTYDIYSSPEQQKAHPEYLACDAAGKPYPGYPTGRGMPRYTDPSFRRAAVIYMNKVFEAIPDLAALSIGPPDGGVKMDARDGGRYGKPGDSIVQQASNYVWDFHMFLANELKRSHPGKYLLYMTGWGADLVPTNIERFPDNVIVPFGQPYSASMVINTTARAELERRRGWLALMPVVRKSPIWDYFLYYRSPAHPRYPVVFTEYLQEEMQENFPYSDGKFIEIQPGPFQRPGERSLRYWLGVPGLTHLMVYWQSKLFWDRNADRRRMLEEYYELFFGPAQAEMKEFYEFAEAVWTRQESRSVSSAGGFLKAPDVDRYFEILKRARIKAGEGSVYDRRIARIEDEMQPLKKLFPNLKRTGPDFYAHTPEGIPPQIDGDLEKPFWSGVNLWYTMGDLVTGQTPEKNQTRVAFRMTQDKSALVVGVICREGRMGRVVAQTHRNDDPEIFQDDAIEIYLEAPERSYFKIAVNTNGTVWDESQDVTIVGRDTLPILWNPGVRAAVRKEADRWTAEILIPTKDLGGLGPQKPYAWGINVCRSRYAGGEAEGFAISPTGIPRFFELSKLGNLWAQ
jgi:hypothetical protein